jgi:hypothetical protein
MTWGSDYSESMSRNWSNSQTYAQSQGVTINGGRIKIDVELINNSSVNVTLVNPMIRLISTDVGAGTISTEIGELTLFTGDGISGDNEVAIPFAPGQNRITRQFGVNTSNPDIIEHLARNSCGLKAQLTNIRFKTSLGEIDTLMANIYRRTAEVTIDFGQAKTSPDNLMKKSIASHAVYNDFYTNQTDRYIPMSLFDLLKATGANPVIGVDSGKTGITEINEIKNGTLKNGIWSTVCQITPDSLQIYSTKFASYDPAKIQAGQSSVISCIYDSDIDGDGVPTRVEAVLGTDDTKVDTDNDSLSDKEEFMGWRRVSDPAGVTWKTNPRLQDTDGDGLDDYVDPDPLSAAENPLDSVVSFSGLKLTPFQGAEWVDTTAISDSLTTFHVNKIMRGNTVVSLKFSHPVYKVMVIYHNGSNVVDTAKILTPDSTGNYSTKINLALGNNEVQVVAISKNGSSTKKVVLIGVDRRLVQIDNTNRNLFYVSAPSTDKLGIAANYFINIDSIKQLDPLIDHIIIARTSIYANVLNATDSANKKCADDLGDTGNGQPISAYSTLTGKDGHNNSYKIAGYLTTDSQSKVYSDDSLAHPYDYAYFPYTANTSNATNGKYYYSAPLTGKGNYFANERTIIIDTVIRFIGCNLLWGSSSPWDVTVSAFYGDYDVGTTTANINNSNNSIAKNIWTGSHEMGPSNDCDLAGQFKVAYLGWPTYDNRTWYTPFAQHINDPSNHFSYSDIINPSNRTSLCWIWYHIDFPQATTKDETPSITLNYSQVSYTDFTKKCWNFEMNDGVYKNHTGGVWVSWRYKFNDIQHD